MIRESDYTNDDAVCKMIASFRYIRCNFKKFENPEYFLYESISTCLSHFSTLVNVFNVGHVIYYLLLLYVIACYSSQALPTVQQRRQNPALWTWCCSSRKAWGFDKPLAGARQWLWGKLSLDALLNTTNQLLGTGYLDCNVTFFDCFVLVKKDPQMV